MLSQEGAENVKKNLRTCDTKERGTLIFLVFIFNLYLFKILLDLGFLFLFIMCDGRSWEKKKKSQREMASSS